MKYILILILFASCKSSEQLYNKAIYKDEVKVAELARRDFPCTKTKIDSVVTIDTLYDYIEIQCPPDTITRIDSFETVYSNIVKVKVPQKIITIRTKETIEDSAKIKVMASTISGYDEENKRISKQLTEVRNSRNAWRKRFIILAALFGVAIFLRIKRVL